MLKDGWVRMFLKVCVCGCFYSGVCWVDFGLGLFVVSYVLGYLW